MKNILIISTILPVTKIERKKKENDILLETEDQLHAHGKDLRFTYIFNVPRTNWFLSMLSKRWKEYHGVQKVGSYILRDRKIHVIGVIRLPVVLPFRNLFFDLSYRLNKKRFARIINETRPHLIHAQDADSSAYTAHKISKDFKIPYVVTLRSVNRVRDSIVQENLKAAAALIALSPTQVRDADGLTNKKIELVPHGIDSGFFAKRNEKRTGLPIRFVTVARLLALKNIDKMINALALSTMDYVFDIYGDGPELERLAEMVKAKGMEDKVFLKGRIPNDSLPKILPGYDMFLMPSYPETLGRVYFEAMACGLPVMATKNTGIDGIISQGKEGFLVRPTQEGISECLMKIEADPALLSKMGEEAYRTAKRYSWKIVSKKYDEIYRSV